MNLKMCFCLLVAALAGLSVFAEAPIVSNVRMSQDTESPAVFISYDLDGADAIITLDVTTNGVSVGGKALRRVAGAVNRKVETGTGLKIVWRPDVSCPNALLSDRAVAKVSVWTEANPPNYMVVSLDGLKDLAYYENEDSLPDGIGSDVYRTTKIVMRRIPAKGIVWRMGSSDADGVDASDETTHYVKLTKDYWMGVFPLTQGQAASGGWSGNYFKGEFAKLRPADMLYFLTLRDNYDTRGVGTNWPAASAVDAHAVRSSSIIGKLRALTDVEFDLPTEAQWEYACRAGGEPQWYTVGGVAKDFGVIARYKGNHTDASATGDPRDGHGSAIVGSYLPNDWGLYDMLGNVYEVCLDRYDANYAMPEGADLATTVFEDPVGAVFDGTNVKRVQRGGEFSSEKNACRVSRRFSASEDSRYQWNIGARLVAPIDGWAR